MNLLYFGLPLGALLLARDGYPPSAVVLSPVDAPGRRRLRRCINAPIIEVGDAPNWTRALDALVGAGLRTDTAAAGSAPVFDLVVSWYFTRRVPARYWQHARLGGIGVHPSLLPRHRGPNPFFWAIDSGDERTGVTLHRLAAAYDAGAILAERAIDVGQRNAWQLARALDRPSLDLLRSGVARLARGEPFRERVQDETRATWAPEPLDDQLRVAWSWPCSRVLRRIRALGPVPGLALEVWGCRLWITRAELSEQYPRALAAGEACLEGNPPRALVIRCGDEAIRATRLTLGSVGEPASVSELAISELSVSEQSPGAVGHPHSQKSDLLHWSPAQDGTAAVDLNDVGTKPSLSRLVGRELPAEQLLPVLLQACPQLADSVFGE